MTTIVLVHGLWMTPRSWAHWVSYYEAKGLTVLAPAYPGFEIEVEALRAKPEIIADLTVPATVEHLASVIEGCATPPIIIGHSFGGTLTQLLLARGLGAAGVVSDSAPAEGVRVNPLSQVRSLFPALRNPATRHKAVGFTPRSSTMPSRTHSPKRSPARCGRADRAPGGTTGPAPGWEEVADYALEWGLAHARRA